MARQRRRNAGRWMAIAVLLAACVPATVLGRTMMEQEMTCPYDGAKFSFVGQGSGTSFGQQLDLKAVGAITSPWPIAVCPTNGFVFYKNKFSDGELEKLRPFILSPEYQATKGESPYYRAFWIVDHSGGLHAEASEKLLFATWESGGDRYARYATLLAERLPKDVENAQGKERDKFVALRGELLRRLGRFDEAAEYLRRWQPELGVASVAWMIVRYELELIAQRDSGIHMVADAINAAEKDRDIWLTRHTPVPVGDTMKRTNAFEFASLRHNPNLQWSLDGKSLTGTEAPLTEYIAQRHNDRLIKFDLIADTRTTLKMPIGWWALDRSKDGKTVMALVDRPGSWTAQGWQFLQVDAQTLEVRHSAPAVSWTGEFAMSSDGTSLLVHGEQGLAAFDVGVDGLRSLPSPAFAEDPKNWRLIAADPTGPRVAVLHGNSVIVWNYEKSTFGPAIQPENGGDKLWPAYGLFLAEGQNLVVGINRVKDRDATSEVAWVHEVTTWNVRTGRLVSRQEVAGAGPCGPVVPSRDRQLFALACWGAVFLSDRGHADHFTEVLRAADEFEFEEIVFSPDSTKLAARTMDAMFVYSIRR